MIENNYPITRAGRDPVLYQIPARIIEEKVLKEQHRQ